MSLGLTAGSVVHVINFESDQATIALCYRHKNIWFLKLVVSMLRTPIVKIMTYSRLYVESHHFLAAVFARILDYTKSQLLAAS